MKKEIIMPRCPKCNKIFNVNYSFCEECGVRLIETEVGISAQPRATVFDGIERSVFFRITRSYTWVILVLAILGFIGAIIYLVSDIRPLIKKALRGSEWVKLCPKTHLR